MGKDCPKYTTIKTWAGEFRRDTISTCTEPESGRQKVSPLTRTPTLFSLAFFFEGIAKLKYHWLTSFDVKRDYVEK